MNLDEFLKQANIELLPFQKEILEKIVEGDKIYILYPPRFGRENAILRMRAFSKIAFSDVFREKGETK